MPSDEAKYKNPKKSSQARLAAEPEQRRIRRSNRGLESVADWAAAEAELLHGVVSAVSSKKCAVQFGYTIDGGSFVVRIVGDGEPYNEYCRATEDINILLRSIALDFGGAV